MKPRDADGVWAVVINWNGGAEDNLACIASLLAAGFEEARIVFVDNASSDGSREAAQARHPRLARIENDTNEGFGGGANRGAQLALEAGASAVLFVNNDVTLAPDCLELLLAAQGAGPELGVLGPRVLDARDPSRLWCAGGMLTWRQNLSTLLGHGQPDGPAWRALRRVDYVAGCAMLVSAEVFAAIGFFEADWFAYGEDVDFCWRAGRAGFGVATVGEASCVHAPSSATGGGYNPRRKYMQGVNSVWFLRKWGGTREWARFFAYDVLTLPPLLLAGAFRGRARAVLAKAWGIASGLAGGRVSAARLEPGGTWLW